MRPPLLAILLTILLLALGAGLRLFDLADEPIDFHPTRQLRGAIVARGMAYEGDPAAPPELRERAVAFWQSTGQYEPPILERVVALTALALNGGRVEPGLLPDSLSQPYVWIARLFNTLLWLVGGVAVWTLARRLAGSPWLALVALAYYLVLPFSVQASRSFQPDPGMTAWLVVAVYFLARWGERPRWRWAILAGLFAGLSILTKAVAAYALAGAALAVVLQRAGGLRRLFTHALRSLQVWGMAALMLAPTVVYYLGRGGRASEYFSSWTLALSHLLLEPAFYLRWLNLVEGLLGWLALVLALAGLFFAGRLLSQKTAPAGAEETGPSRSAASALLGLWVGYVAYGLFVPYQMYTHSYYHLQLVPLTALALALAFRGVGAYGVQPFTSRWLALGAAVISIAWVTYASWQALVPLYDRDYRSEPAYWQGIAAKLPAEGKIIALTQDYGYRLMYYGWRKVTLWPNRGEFKVMQLRGSDKEFQAFFAKRIEGKDYFLVTAFNQYEDQANLQQVLTENYPVSAQGPGYLIFDLRKP